MAPPLDIGPAPELWLPPRPAIIRLAEDLWRPPEGSLLASFLPGMFPAGAIATDEAPLTLSFVGSSTATGASITPHASAAIGDIAILCQYSANDSPSAVTPGDFTNRINVLNTAARFMIDTAILVSTSAVTGMDGSEGDCKIMFIFRPSRPLVSITAFDASSATSSSGGGTPSVIINASGGAAPLLVIGFEGLRNPNERCVSSVGFDGTVSIDGGTPEAQAGYSIHNTSPVDHTIGGNTSGPGGNSEVLGGLWLEAA